MVGFNSITRRTGTLTARCRRLILGCAADCLREGRRRLDKDREHLVQLKRGVTVISPVHTGLQYLTI